MDMQHFCDVHYAKAFQPISELGGLPKDVYDLIRCKSKTGVIKKV